MTVTTYVTYLLPGLMFNEETSRKVPTRDPQRDVREAPAGAFAFTYHDMVTEDVQVRGETVSLSSRAINKSGRYYIDAEVMTRETVENLPGDYSILLSNMKSNGWDKVLRCRAGNFQPLVAGDRLVYS